MKGISISTVACLAICACGQPTEAPPAGDEARAAARQAIERYVVDFWSKGDSTAIDGVLADTMVVHFNGAMFGNGLAANRQSFSFRSHFDGLTGTIDAFTFDGDIGAVATTWTGTYLGGICDTPGTGARSTWVVNYLFRMSEGRIVELWEAYDQESMKRTAGIDLSRC
jgi:predicted ester cyclase